MSTVNSLIQPLAAISLVAALVALADGKTALEIKNINTAADTCLRQIIMRNHFDPNYAKFTYEFYTDAALRKVKYAAKDKSGTISVGDITAGGCRILDSGILSDAIKCAQEKFRNAAIPVPVAKNVPYEPTFSEVYARTPCTFATVPEAAIECLRSLANAAALTAGFKGVNIPFNKKGEKLSDYAPRFTPALTSGKKWQHKFTFENNNTPSITMEFKVAVSDVTAEHCPSLNYNDLTKIQNCVLESFKGSSGQLEKEAAKKVKSYTYDELEAVFIASSKSASLAPSCKLTASK